MDDGYTLKNFIITLLILSPIFILLGFLEIGLISDEFIDSNIGWLAFGFVILGSFGSFIYDYIQYIHSGVLISPSFLYFLLVKAENHFKFLYVTSGIFIGMASLFHATESTHWKESNIDESPMSLLIIPIFLASMIGTFVIIYYSGIFVHFILEKITSKFYKNRFKKSKDVLFKLIDKDSKLNDLKKKLDEKNGTNSKLFEYDQKHYDRTLELAEQAGLDDLDFYFIESELEDYLEEKG